MAAAVIMAATVAAVIMAAMVVAVMAAAVMAAAILNLIPLLEINLLGQKVGKTEAMETLQKTLNLKVEEVEEKEEFPARRIHLILKI